MTRPIYSMQIMCFALSFPLFYIATQETNEWIRLVGIMFVLGSNVFLGVLNLTKEAKSVEVIE